MNDTYRAMIVEKTADGFIRRIGRRRFDELPEGEVLVRVHYSSLNYKDALSATGNPGVSRKFPHTPGIDAAGVVKQSGVAALAAGQEVIVTSFDLGMNTPGGFGEYIRVPASWVVSRPEGLNLAEAMGLGTAGFTAAMSLQRLIDAGVRPDQGEILVTGATGGVGSLAVSLLARAGYSPVAVTGKTGEDDYLRRLGAVRIISRDELLKGSERPLLKEQWAGAIDVAGGPVLAAAIKGTRYGGAVTCCGLVASPELPLNVYPFILRGVSLHGIDSAQCPNPLRQQIWDRLAGDWKLPDLMENVTTCTLEELDERIEAMLSAKLKGRTLVRL